MRIIIGADIVPTQTNKDLFINSDANALVGEKLYDILRSADQRIFNLEVPLTDMEAPISKFGPNLIAPSKTVSGYKAIGVDILTLANNHILDQGEEGLASTQKVLETNHIAYLGAGINREKARKPYIFKCDEKKIGVYACAEHEFSIVSENKPGANPFDPLESIDHVEKLKQQCDYVIVLYHGGKEHYRYPSPNLQKTCRQLVEKGANLVVCQHSHCIGCEEKYGEGTIVYGQGNFLFDHSNSEFWRTGLLISIGENFLINYIPIIKQNETVRLADEIQAKEILDEFNRRSDEIKQPGVVEKKYSKFAEDSLYIYLRTISGKKSFLFRALDKLSKRRYSKWYFKRKFNKNSYLAIMNYIECEAHRELMLEGLKQNHE